MYQNYYVDVIIWVDRPLEALRLGIRIIDIALKPLARWLPCPCSSTPQLNHLYKDFREISARHDALEKLPDHDDERHFRTSRDDRAWIVDRMQEQHPQNVERCQDDFAQKDQIDREKMAKQATRNMDMDLEL